MLKKAGLIISGIGSFKKNNPVVFFVYIIGYMLMCFVFIYVYTNFMPRVIAGADNRSESKYYCFSIPEVNNNCDYEKLYEYLRTFNPLYCNLSTDISMGELIEDRKDNEKVRVLTRMDSDFKDYFFSGIDNPKKVNEALMNNENIIILPKSLDYNEKTITIENDEFFVISADYGNPDVVLPFYAFKKYFTPKYITIVVGETLRNGRHEEFLNQIQNEFGLSVDYEPSEFLGSDYEINMYYTKKIAVVFGVAVCVFMMLVRFLLEYSKYEYTIYRLAGAGYDTVISLVFLQTIIINSMLIILSIGLYKLFYDAFFEKINMYREIYMKISDFCFMSGILLMFSTIAIVPFIIYSIRNSVSKCINYYS